MRTIRVTGKGNIKVRPDTTRLMITIEGRYKDYSDTLKHSSEDTESLRELLTGFGFDKRELKTTSFDVNAEYESYQEKGVYKNRFVGYRSVHAMKLEFPSDNDRLGRILYALAHSKVNPEFRISYTVKDQEAAKNELLGQAIADASAKAEVISAAAGVKLCSIQSIDYSWGEINFEVSRTRGLALEKVDANVLYDESYDVDIEPDDISVSDTVTVVWEIE
ncbi:MAG: SIMPL domain-containing protein [Clostridiales bacterium]|nr:SIMPL domain-containing protein [Clostridiales bacterium]